MLQVMYQIIEDNGGNTPVPQNLTEGVFDKLWMIFEINHPRSESLETPTTSLDHP